MATAQRVGIWDAVTSGATIQHGHFDSRRMFRSRGVFTGDGVVIWWTLDGTSSGSTLFNVNNSPWVQVVVSDPVDKGGYGRTGGYGFVVVSNSGHRADLHFSRTALVSSRWKTIVYAGGVGSDGFLDHSGAGRLFYAFAVETQP